MGACALGARTLRRLSDIVLPYYRQGSIAVIVSPAGFWSIQGAPPARSLDACGVGRAARFIIKHLENSYILQDLSPPLAHALAGKRFVLLLEYGCITVILTYEA